jgi:uncharacterized membrane protein YkoI
MKYNHERLIEAQKTVALVNACSVSIEQAISAARSSLGGTVFDAKLKEVDQQLVWRVKLVVGGQRVKVYVDAHSGGVIHAKAEVLVHERFRRNGFVRRDMESSLDT